MGPSSHSHIRSLPLAQHGEGASDEHVTSSGCALAAYLFGGDLARCVASTSPQRVALTAPPDALSAIVALPCLSAGEDSRAAVHRG